MVRNRIRREGTSVVVVPLIKSGRSGVGAIRELVECFVTVYFPLKGNEGMVLGFISSVVQFNNGSATHLKIVTDVWVVDYSLDSELR